MCGSVGALFVHFFLENDTKTNNLPEKDCVFASFLQNLKKTGLVFARLAAQISRGRLASPSARFCMGPTSQMPSIACASKSRGGLYRFKFPIFVSDFFFH